MNPPFDVAHSLLMLAESDITSFGTLVKREHQDDVDERSKILATLKARDNATKHDTAPPVQVLGCPSK